MVAAASGADVEADAAEMVSAGPVVVAVVGADVEAVVNVAEGAVVITKRSLVKWKNSRCRFSNFWMRISRRPSNG